MGAYDLLAVTRINGIWDALKDVRIVNEDFRWVAGNKAQQPLLYGVGSTGARIPIKRMLWGEITARFTDRPTIAPIISYNAAAPMKTLGPTVQLQQHNIPKIKHGAHIPEDTLQMILRIQQNLESGMTDNMQTKDDVTVFTNWLQRQIEMMAKGTLIRLEAMAIGMLAGQYLYNDPNNHGTVLSMTWQIPAEANVVPGTLWGDGSFGISHANVNATPLSDYWAMRTTLETTYGVEFTRASIPLQGLLYVFGTNEFRNNAPAYMARYGIAPAQVNIAFNDTHFMTTILEAMWRLTIEVDDRKFMVEDNALDNWVDPLSGNAPASGQYARYQPVNQCIFTMVADDGDLDTFDIGDVPVMESIAGLVPGMIGQPTMGDNTFGPYTYVSASNLAGDPPGFNIYSVRNSLPRRKKLLCSAVITFGP